jgi:hypothetical protein
MRRWMKPLTKGEILALVETKLTHLRDGYRDPARVLHPQERDLMLLRKGEIEALEEVRLLLRGERGTFVIQ